MDRLPKPGECYRHFKNKLYQIITVAEHTETGEQMVVYQALYGAFGTFVRPLSMFISEVDHEKYPEAQQKYRFEKVELKTAAPVCEEALAECDPMVAVPDAEEEIPSSSKNLLAFLDAETYHEKLEVLKAYRDKFSGEELSAVCEALDIGTHTGQKEDMFQAVVNYLEMQAKYDGARLR